MSLTMFALALLAGLAAPGRTVTLTEIGAGGIRTAVFDAGRPLDDTVIELEGTWGLAVNAGNFDDDPELEYVCRLSDVGQQNTRITRVAVFDHDLSRKWAQTWGYMGNPEPASVTVADLDLDGYDDLIIPMCETFFPDPPNYKCRVYVLDAMSGRTKPGWPFICPGWPEDPYNDIYAEVAAADINGDDTLELVFMTTDFNSARKGGASCYALNLRGDSLWRTEFYPGDTINQHGCWTGPAVADLDGDGLREIICHVNLHGRYSPWPLLERRLFILNSDGSIRREWQTQGAISAQSTDYASPVVADIDLDGAPEIIILRRTGYLDVFDTSGTRLDGFPVDLTEDAGYVSGLYTKSFSHPSVADLAGDERLEIVVGSFGLVASGADWGGHIHVFGADGRPVPGFPFETRNAVWHAPGIGNVDSTPGFEILTAGCDSSFYVVSAGGESLPGWPKRDFPTYFLPDQGNMGFVEGHIPLCKTPLLWDADGDGLTEILMTGSDGRWFIWDTDAACATGELPWPTLRFDKQRTGSPWAPQAAARERPAVRGPEAAAGPTIVRGSLNLHSAICNLQSAIVLLDASGRKVMALSPGPNDVSRLSPGVYFVHSASGPGRGAPAVARVVLAR
ncbi:MAG: hypothetical protein R6X12_05145 [bacterium]